MSATSYDRGNHELEIDFTDDDGYAIQSVNLRFDSDEDALNWMAELADELNRAMKKAAETEAEAEAEDALPV